MRLRRAAAIVAGIAVTLAPARASAGVLKTVEDVIGWPVKAVFGSALDKAAADANGVVNNANGVVNNANGVVNNVDAKLKFHEGQIKDLGNQLLDKTDSVLGTRILELTGGLKDVVKEIGGVATGVVDKANKDVLGIIATLDKDLHDRSADVNQMVDDRVGQVDQALADRISQLDEVAGRRLGDVDAIASEQRIGLEGMLIRVAVIIGGVVFAVYVLRVLWQTYVDLEEEEAHAQTRGARRTALWLGKVGPQLVAPMLAACAGAALLGALYRLLPSDAAQQGEALVQRHQQQLADSMRLIDSTRARMEASHLGIIDPSNAAHYEGLAEKVALVRDFIARPGIVATPDNLSRFTDRLVQAERQVGPRPDPDLLTLRAMLAWKTGKTRRAEHEAASLAARALELAPQGFGLEPLARAYVSTFLEQPYFAEDAGEGRDAASWEDMNVALAVAAPDAPDSPLAGIADLARLMRALEEKSTESYVRMAEANAAAVVAKSQGKTADLKLLLEERTKQATAVVDAWKNFDRSLLASERIQGRMILKVFGLNDAILTRALYYATETEALSRHGVSLLQVGEIERVHLAPARIIWSRRYAALVTGTMKDILESEEAEQFHAWERWTLEFEDALVADASTKASERVDTTARWRIAVAAAALGIYVEGPEHRVAYAWKIARDIQEAPVVPSPVDKKKAAVTKSDEPAPPTSGGAPTTLDELLSARGPQLI